MKLYIKSSEFSGYDFYVDDCYDDYGRVILTIKSRVLPEFEAEAVVVDGGDVRGDIGVTDYTNYGDMSDSEFWDIIDTNIDELDDIAIDYVYDNELAYMDSRGFGHMVYSSRNRRGRRIYAEDEVENEDIDNAEGEEDVENEDTGDEVAENDGDVPDSVDEIQLTGNVEADFDTLIEVLQQTDYEDLGGASGELNDILQDPKLYDILAYGFGEGELADVSMSSSAVSIPVSQLKPSQNEIGLSNSLAYALKSDCSYCFDDPFIVKNTPIVTYNDEYVIDGHHRWSQAYMINPDATISAVNFTYNDKDPYRALRNFQGAIAVATGAGKQFPYSKADKLSDVYSMSEDQIRDYIDSNMQDVCWQSLVDEGVCEDRESAIEYIVDNVMQLKKNNAPDSDAPERQYMPQINDQAQGIAEEGQTNI